MEWDQALFKKALDLVRGLVTKAQDPLDEAERVHLDLHKDRLTILARMLCGAPIEIMKAEQEGGWTGNVFFLPPSTCASENYEENLEFFLFRVFYMSLQKELGLNWKEASQAGDLSQSRDRARQSSAQVLGPLLEQYPGLQRILQHLKQTLPEDSPMLWGKWFPPASGKEGALSDPALDNPADHQLTAETEIEAPAREMVDVIDADKKAISDWTLMHSFEKVDTLEEYKGGWRDLDGSDELTKHEEALKEVKLETTVRVDDPVHSIYRSEYLRNAFIPLSRDSQRAGTFVTYDEWDSRKGRYLPDYCKVYPAPAQLADKEYVTSTLTKQQPAIRKLRQSFSRFYNENEMVRHQTSGEEIDIERLVDNFAELHAGKTPSEKVYMSSRKRRKDLSILFLLDLSLSTDAYSGGKRVLDVEKQSVIAFCEVLNEFGSRFRVDGFSSRTRNNCDYVAIKGFDEDWSSSRAKIGGLQPAGYTRIGPALRHATSLLEKECTRKKWIVMLSDGKPNDYDRYEGRHGIEDVRRAYREATKKDVHIYTLAIEESAKHYLPRMFGNSAFRILKYPELLPEALSEFYLRLNR